MTDDDPFADLGETLDDGSDENTTTDTDTMTDTETSADSATTATTDDATESTSRDPTTDPAFTYEDAHQRPFYAREATIDDFDSWLNYELERELNERGYQNIVVREMTDALLRTVVAEDLVDAVAERFEDARDDATAESNE